ncbi:MAG: DUF4080 domain-containing protein [Clostridia bacterium]|nr:DUF4080 domain-containing protein [Clostridia bacterium]
MKFKAVICALNSKYIHSSLAPWCLYTAFKERGIQQCECRVAEGTINEKTENIYNRITEEKPDVVAFSCYIWNIGRVLEIAEELKESGVIIALGGPEVSYRQRDILENYSFVDYVLSGEGEEIFPELVASLADETDIDIKGVSLRKDGKIIVSDGEFIDFDKTASPYCKEYFESLGNRIAYIESSRGCPFSCAFCLSGRCGKVRFIPLERVKSEMVLLSEMGATTIKFVDRTFNCNPKRALEILSFIKEEYGKKIPDGVCFHFEIAADILTQELFEVISQLPVGAVQFEVGIQSFNEETLKKINRKTNVDIVESNVKRLLSFGNCHVHIDLIVGLPLEGYDSFVSGFNRAYKIKANMLQLGFLKILYGSPMGEDKESYPCIYSCEAPYEVISTPYITEEELNKLRICENETDRLYNSGRFSRTLEYVTRFTEPFDSFFGFGEFLISKSQTGSIPLDKYTCFAYEYFSLIRGVDKMRLRDLMLLDRISTNNSDVIPSCLKVADCRLGKLKKMIADGSVKSVAILYSENIAIYCDYSENRNPVTGQWNIKKIDVDL